MIDSSIGGYLLNKLHSLGVEHIFGIPGDYILPFDKLIENHPIQFINATRENTAGYMADAYARFRGLGVVCITYGVGINIANAISQAYMESSPMVVISGSPSDKELQRSHRLHHLIHKFLTHDFENTQLEIFKQITVAQAVLNNPETAQKEIDQVIDVAMSLKKPVYIELPRDRVNAEINLTMSHSFLKPKSQIDSLKKALDETQTLLETAKKPLLWIGHEILRHGLSENILRFAEKNHLPIVTSLLGKTAIDERHPLFAGIYQGALSRSELIAFIDDIDALLVLGVVLNDMDTGLFTAKLDLEKQVIADSSSLTVRHKKFDDVVLTDYVLGLNSLLLSPKSAPKIPHLIPKSFEASPNKKIKAQKVFDCLQKHFSQDHILVADIGDALLGSSDLLLPQNSYLACAYFASMGFAIPGAIGAQMALNKRPIVLVGDGAFQISGLELSTAIRYHLNPIVIVLNNHGYGTERPLLEGSFNDIQNWNYFKLPELLGGGKGQKVSTEEAFEEALVDALANLQTFSLIEVDLDKCDFSLALQRFGQVMRQLFTK